MTKRRQARHRILRNSCLHQVNSEFFQLFDIYFVHVVMRSIITLWQMMSYLRRCDVIMSHQRHNDIVCPLDNKYTHFDINNRISNINSCEVGCKMGNFAKV